MEPTWGKAQPSGVEILSVVLQTILILNPSTKAGYEKSTSSLHHTRISFYSGSTSTYHYLPYQIPRSKSVLPVFTSKIHMASKLLQALKYPTPISF